MTTPTDSYTLAQDYLRTMLADCPAVRTWMDVSTQAAALLRIHHEGLPAPAGGADEHTAAELVAHRPYIILWTDEERGYTLTLDGAGGHDEFSDSGRLKLRLVQNAPDTVGDEPTSEANHTWRQTIGQILDDLCDLSGLAGYLSFRGISVEYGPFWSHPKVAATQGVWQAVEIAITWGSQ